MAYDVFISHSSKDKTVADAACARLESRGIRCWIAPRDIRPGDEWGSSIIKAIRGARIMVLIFSSHANASPQIRREVERAVNAGATVIPVRIEDVLPQESLDYFLGTPHWLDAFTPPLEQHLDRLAEVIHEILELPAPVPPGAARESAPLAESAAEPAPLPTEIPPARPEPVPPPSKPPGRGWLIGVGVVLAFLILGALGYYYGIATPAEKVRQAEAAQKQADEKAASAEAEKEKADAALAQARSDDEKAAAQKAKEDADARAAAAQQAADQAKANADKAKEVAASTTALQPGQNFTAGNGMEMNWVKPMNGWVGKYLVTQAEYEAVMGNNPSHFKGPRRPVDSVSWNDAMAYCQKLTGQDHVSGKLPAGYKYNLPTDAQYDIFVGDASLDDAVTSVGTNRSEDADVGTQVPNEYGLYDTRGELLEFCLDWYDQSIYEKDANPGKSTTTIGEVFKILRGSSWRSNGAPESAYLAVSFRSGDTPAEHFWENGFRVVVNSASIAASAASTPAAAPEEPAFPVAGQPWTNSLGVKFVPAGTDGVLFSVWDVRVQDYAAFVEANPGYAAGPSWKNPGFTQTDNDPVVDVSWNDAHAFCDL